VSAGLRSGSGVGAGAGLGKSERQRIIRELVARQSIGSQEELAEHLRDRGYPVTQATISRDIAEIGLVKIARADRHVYVSPADLAIPPASDGHLRRIVGDIPVRVGRSGLILLLTGSPGTASVLGQAIDESTMDEQEGTLAGDNTLLVLFRDEARLERWLARFRAIQGRPPEPAEPDFVTLSGPTDGLAHFTEAPR
jgi:transcriptional regulator of arginine metabolism